MIRDLARRAAVLGVAAALLTLAPVAVRGAGAGPLDDEDRGTHCFIDKYDTLSPGLSLQGSSGAVATPGPGVIECHGKVRGHDPTGDGQVTEQGRYGTKDPDTCQGGGEGEGKMIVAIPTSGGLERFEFTFTFTFGEPSTHGGVVAGRFTGDGVHGTFDATPEEGDCVAKPVTKVHTIDDVRFDDSFFSTH